MDIYGVCVHRGCIRHGGAVRAGIKPAPTPRFRFSCRGGLYGRSDRVPIPAKVRWFHRRRGALYMRPCRTAGITGPASDIAGLPGRIYNPPLSVSKKSFRHAVRIFKLSKKFKNTCRLNAKGAFCPLHTSPAALSQTSSARFFDSLPGRIYNPPLRCVRPAMVHLTRPPVTGSRFLPGTMVQWSDFRPAPHMVRRLSGVRPWVSQ